MTEIAITAPLGTPDTATSACPGCRAVLPAEDGPTHPYFGSSPACWARYGLVLAREFQDPAYFTVHQLTVVRTRSSIPGARNGGQSNQSRSI